MGDREVTRWQHNRIYTQPAHTHRSLRVHNRIHFDLSFKNFHIPVVYDYEIVFVAVVDYFIFCNQYSKQVTLKNVRLYIDDFATMV